MSVKEIKVPRLRKKQKESSIEAAVCNYARNLGVLPRKYTSPSHRSVPDRLFLFPAGLAVFIEFKAPGGKLTLGQQREIIKLQERGHLVYVIDNTLNGKQLVDFWLYEIHQRGFSPAGSAWLSKQRDPAQPEP